MRILQFAGRDSSKATVSHWNAIFARKIYQSKGCLHFRLGPTGQYSQNSSGSLTRNADETNTGVAVLEHSFPEYSEPSGSVQTSRVGIDPLHQSRPLAELRSGEMGQCIRYRWRIA